MENMSLKRLNFTEDDKSKTILELMSLHPRINNIFQYFGLTQDDINRVVDIHDEFIQSEMSYTDENVQDFGFADLADCHLAFAKVHIYLYSETSMSIEKVMLGYCQDMLRYYPTDKFADPPQSGNLVDYVMTFTLPQLVGIGLPGY